MHIDQCLMQPLSWYLPVGHYLIGCFLPEQR
jgi:hypothetical protein